MWSMMTLNTEWKLFYPNLQKDYQGDQKQKIQLFISHVSQLDVSKMML